MAASYNRFCMAQLKRPLIGVNLDFECDPHPRSVIRDAYYDAVYRAGGCVVLLPPVNDPEHIASTLDRLDGVVLTGGDDIDPQLFGEEPHPTCKLLARRRHDFDLVLIRAALDRRMPVLAI